MKGRDAISGRARSIFETGMVVALGCATSQRLMKSGAVRVESARKKLFRTTQYVVGSCVLLAKCSWNLSSRAGTDVCGKASLKETDSSINNGRGEAQRIS